jgi:hypothetical protein
MVYPLFFWRWLARAMRIKGHRLWLEPMACAGSKKPVNDRVRQLRQQPRDPQMNGRRSLRRSSEWLLLASRLRSGALILCAEL